MLCICIYVKKIKSNGIDWIDNVSNFNPNERYRNSYIILFGLFFNYRTRREN